MNADLNQMHGYQVYDYKIVLVPHSDLAHQIGELRKSFNEEFKVETPTSSIPQVVLATFSQVLAFEERIINRFKLVAMGSHPVKVEIKGFGNYPSHTIFLNVTSKVPIGDLVKKIRHDAQKLMKLDNDNKPHFLTDSHITIAQKLKPWQFEKGWLEYSNKHFTGRFIADDMLLLRRKHGEFKFKTIESFEFKNMPIDVKQGELFQ